MILMRRPFLLRAEQRPRPFELVQINRWRPVPSLGLLLLPQLSDRCEVGGALG